MPKFKKVMPVEYRRALAEMAKHQAADKTGFDVLEIGLQGGEGLGCHPGPRARDRK